MIFKMKHDKMLEGRKKVWLDKIKYNGSRVKSLFSF